MLKLVTGIAGLALLLVLPVRGAGFYDVDSVRTIAITFEQSNWDEILDSFYAAGQEERLLGTVVIDGVTYDSVGIRYKGTSSYHPARRKNPFNIKLDYVHDDQKIDGYGTLKLANVWSDPSFLREVLSYEIARKYIPASLANYANVSVNGELLGLYVNVEDVGKRFMREHFGSDGNARFKGELLDPAPNYAVWSYEGEDSTAYQTLFELESGAGWSELVDLMDTLNNHNAGLDEILNVDRHLWMLAFDVLLVNLDSPLNFAHNYYLYRDDDNRFNPIIWDLNQSFGAFNLVRGGSSLSINQMKNLTPFFNASNPLFPIVSRILDNAVYRKMYVAHLKTMTDENFTNGWYESRALELRSIIATHVLSDPNKFYSYQSFLDNLNSAVGAIPGITQLMDARVNYLNSVAEFSAPAPVIGVVDVPPDPVAAFSEVKISAQVSNANVVMLAYRSEPIARFTKAPMYDDGLHGDGAARDLIYGTNVIIGATEFHYYIYAENAAAASFSPARAEFVDYSLTVSPLPALHPRINEFVADNASIIADPDGEFEDWIEVFNPHAETINLRGFHLSDKTDNIGKWTFPDTVIAPGGYLIVWADEDLLQSGLHANFKLSASGEAVVLADSNRVVVDQVTFGSQSTDLSFGRCPNGTGEFTSMSPTPAAANECAYVCGDASGDASISVADAVVIVNYIFAGGAPPSPYLAADSDCNAVVTIADAVFLINFIFADGPPPCADCQ